VVRVLIFHGYLLRGTGSNIYNASLARALVDLGHEVHILCQDHDAGNLPVVDAVGTWNAGRLTVRVVREPVRCTAYLPDIGRVLPVYVADPYEHFDAVLFTELDDAALRRYVHANVEAVRAVADRARPDVGLANHAVMGPLVLARALGGHVPYAVKIHGSALEYTVARDRERFLPYAREGLAAATGVLVGSGHTAGRLWAVLDDLELPAKTRLGPPGVDVDSFRPRSPDERAPGLRDLAARMPEEAATWGGEPGASEALATLAEATGPIVTFVGKLIVSKGVELLLAAWPLVLARVPEARLCVVGFGTLRPALGQMVESLTRGDLDALREMARRGRELEGGPVDELEYLAAFLDQLEGVTRDEYRSSAGRVAESVLFTGRLEHDDLPDLLGASAALVVPSTFPEAFGMVAAEAAACGALPISAAHSGLAEVSATLTPALDPGLRDLLAFPLGPSAVSALSERLIGWLLLPSERRHSEAAAVAGLARERYGWEGVARGVIATAEGRLKELPEPRVPEGSQRARDRTNPNAPR
jgi:glycosyltransferase involved in cell wall biosynthesis